MARPAFLTAHVGGALLHGVPPRHAVVAPPGFGHSLPPLLEGELVESSTIKNAVLFTSANEAIFLIVL